MKRSATIQILAGIVFTIVGLAGGWYLATADKETAHEEAASVAPVGLSQQALANMGVEIGELKQQTYIVAERVPAVVAATPATNQPLITPVAGRVLQLNVQIGQKVRGGEVIATVLRDAFARPELGLTGEILRPASEEFHATKGKLRKALKSLSILDAELERLAEVQERAGKTPVVPRQNLINLRYEKAQMEQDIVNLRTELKLHGLSAEQIAKVEAGEELILDLQVWYAILRRNGIWDAKADALLSSLDKDTSTNPWAIATIGELVTQSLVSDDLVAWFKQTPAASKSFLPIAAMLLEGQSLERIQWLEKVNAFAPIVEVRAPVSAEDWDVIAIHVKVNEHLEASTSIATLANPRELFFEAEPVGSELVSLNRSIKSGLPIKATPLTPGAGPTLEGLTFSSISLTESDRTVARLIGKNTVLATTKNDLGREFRSWALRPGMKYMLHVPVRNLEKVYVVPADAVVQDGTDRVIYVRNGDTFLPAKVVVLHETATEIVLGSKSDVFSGDPVATRRAFALKLAIMAGKEGPVDPHAGHNH